MMRRILKALYLLLLWGVCASNFAEQLLPSLSSRSREFFDSTWPGGIITATLAALFIHPAGAALLKRDKRGTAGT
jgi:hypothetical protein